MPQSLLIDLDKVREKNELHTLPIAVNHYAGTVAEERQRYGDERLLTVLRSMILIREVETMLYSIKRGDEYHGITLRLPRPGAPVDRTGGRAAGQALALTRRRPHVREPPEPWRDRRAGDGGDRPGGGGRLEELMDSYLVGRTPRWSRALARPWREAEGECVLPVRAGGGDLRPLDGLQPGLGGSMHAFFTPFGIYPNNAIVGGAAPIAAGAGLYKRVQRSPGLAIANIGDGSTGCGMVWEAMNFAAHGAVPVAFDEAAPRRPAGRLLLREQLLCDGRPDDRRDDGLRAARADRRRDQSGEHACGVDRRDEPARGRRRGRPRTGVDRRG